MKKSIIFLGLLMLTVTSCKNEKKGETTGAEPATAPMENKQDRNKKVVMASIESFLKGDYDAAFRDAGPGFIDYTDGSMPPINSIDSLKAMVKMMTAAFDNYKGENLRYYADGDHVLVVGDWSGVFKRDLMGIKATGKPFKYRDTDIFKLNDDGKIIEHSSVQNVGAVLATSGMMK